MAKEVVFVTGRNPTEGKGGGSCYVRAHMRAAMRAGFEPHVFCIDAEAGTTQENFGFVHRVVSPLLSKAAFGAPKAARSERFFAHWLAAFALSPYAVVAHAGRLAANVERFLSARAGPHLIHGFYTWGCVGLDVRERLQCRGVETVVVTSVYTTAGHEACGKTRGADRENLLYRAVYRAERLWIDCVVRRQERRAYTESRLVLLNYDSVRRLLLVEHGEGAEIRKTPYSSEAAFLSDDAPGTAPPLERPDAASDAPLIVSVSRHDPRKGVDVLLRALAALRDAGVRFRACLVSGGPLLESHRRLAERLRLADVTTFTGWVADPHPFLRRADVFVLPSLQEGGGSISLLEALQAGLAIVASNVDGIAEDVRDGENALLVEPGNADQLSRALALALTDADLRERLRRRAHQTFGESFSAETFSAAMGRIYAELVVAD
jgi:glycosyltransferase involved in cell wall biosynthesis